MDLGGYLRVFRERWLAILVCFLLGIAAAAAITTNTTPTYQAGTSLFLKVSPGTGSLYDASQFSVQRVKSYPDLVDSPNVLEPVIRDLGLKTTPQALANQVSATNPIDTVSLRVTAQSTNARQAAQIANAVAVELSKEVARLETSTTATTAKGKAAAANQSSIDLVLTVPARTPQKPLTPNRTLNFAVGALGGLAAGLILAIVMSLADRRLRTAKDVRRAGGLPLIGQLPRGRRGWRPLLARAASEDASAAYEEVMTNLQLVANGRFPRVLVLAPATKLGKTEDLRYGLASAAVASGRSAIVVETASEAARSVPSTTAGAKEGLSGLLTGSVSLSGAVVSDSQGGPASLPLGTGAMPARGILDAHLADLLTELRQTYDLVVAESTATSRPLELGMLATEADAVVLVAQYAKTHPDQLTRLVAQLEVAHIQPVGVLLISVPRWRRVVVMEEWVPSDISDSARPSSHLHKVADNSASTPPRMPSSRRDSSTSAKESLA